MTALEILEELKPLGSESYKRVMRHHGAKEPFFGVKIGDLKKIVRRVKQDHQLALDLYETGNYDAMYLAGLIADDQRMTRADLRRWVDGAYCGALAGTAVASVAAGSRHGWDLALEWIDSEKPLVAVAGWATLASLVSVKPDTELDLANLKQLLQRAKQAIHLQPDAVRYQMNHFIICVGSYVASLTGLAIETGEAIGRVSVDLGDNSCDAFYSPDSIRKVQKRGAIGKKRKSAKC